MTELLQAEGPRATIVVKFAEWIARSATFAEATGIDDWQKVLAKHVHYPSLEVATAPTMFPFGVVGLPPGGGYRRSRLADGMFSSNGRVRFVFGRTYSPEASAKDPLISFLNWSDGIIADIERAAEEDGFRIFEWTEVMESQRTDPAEESVDQPYYDNWFDVEWGTFR